MTRRAAIPPAREVKDGRDDVVGQVAELLDEIAGELNLLSESRINPHAFFERRDMLTRRLRGLAKRLRGGEAAPKLSMAERRAEMAAVCSFRKPHG